MKMNPEWKDENDKRSLEWCNNEKWTLPQKSLYQLKIYFDYDYIDYESKKNNDLNKTLTHITSIQMKNETM